MTRRRAWICDFDGTISEGDIGSALLETFALPGAGAMRRELFERWVRDEIGSRELTVAECEPVRVDEATAREFVRRFAIDPGFAAFARAIRAAGEELVVVSDGFDFYIHEHLDRAGLAGLPVRANVARFVDGRIVPEFPYQGGCGRCGNCKSIHVAEWKARGFEAIVVGDGYSDRCAARAADRVHAKRHLLAWCRKEGMPVTEFTGFEPLATEFGPPPDSDPRAGGPNPDPDTGTPRLAAPSHSTAWRA